MRAKLHSEFGICQGLWIVALGVVLAGCGASKQSSITALAPALPPCAKAGPAVNLPSEFPANFPLPPGTIITFSQQTERAATVSGFIPMEFKNVVAFFQSKLPAAGYKLLEGDAEMDEAESTFSGQGIQGKWKVNGILSCPGAVTLTIAVSKT